MTMVLPAGARALTAFAAPVPHIGHLRGAGGGLRPVSPTDLTIHEAQGAVEEYLAGQGYPNLESGGGQGDGVRAELLRHRR
jgi:hypothetical protein